MFSDLWVFNVLRWNFFGQSPVVSHIRGSGGALTLGYTDCCMHLYDTCMTKEVLTGGEAAKKIAKILTRHGHFLACLEKLKRMDRNSEIEIADLFRQG